MNQEPKTEYKIAIVGPHNVVSVFKATGAEVFSAETGDDAVMVIRKIRKDMADGLDKYAVVVIIESLVREIKEDEYAKITSGSLPAVIAVPGIEGSTGEALKKLKKLAERAVGMAVIK